MIKVDEHALICDLAETYQIYDYRQLPASLVAVFCYGLRDDSRIKLKMSGQNEPFETILLASISDKLNTLIWFETEDGQKGRNRPQSIVESLMSNNNKKDNDMVSFSSGKEFLKEREKLLKGGE